MKIGVLAIQGGFIEHINHVKALGHEAFEVRALNDLNDIDGLILPGGESTTMGKILREQNLLQPIKERIICGLPAWGTCAGMILLAKEIENCNINHIATMDIKVKRNAYGNQLDSFKVSEAIPNISKNSIDLIFIRAPYIVNVGKNVNILHKTNNNIVAAREDNMLVTSFHPELSQNLDFHKYFINMCYTKKH